MLKIIKNKFSKIPFKLINQFFILFLGIQLIKTSCYASVEDLIILGKIGTFGYGCYWVYISLKYILKDIFKIEEV